MKFILVALLLIISQAVVPAVITNCQTGADLTFTTGTFSIVPQKGTDNTITLYGDAHDYVDLSHVILKAKWNGVDVFNTRQEEKKVYNEDDSVIYKQTANFPTFTPSGKIVLNFYFYDTDGVERGCAETGFTL